MHLRNLAEENPVAITFRRILSRTLDEESADLLPTLARLPLLIEYDAKLAALPNVREGPNRDNPLPMAKFLKAVRLKTMATDTGKLGACISEFLRTMTSLADGVLQQYKYDRTTMRDAMAWRLGVYGNGQNMPMRTTFQPGPLSASHRR